MGGQPFVLEFIVCEKGSKKKKKCQTREVLQLAFKAEKCQHTKRKKKRDPSP